MESKIEIYSTSGKQAEVRVQFDNDTVWLSQEQMAILFERDRTVISRHIRNIFKEGELKEKVVCANFAHTTQHGAMPGKLQKAETTHYNLDVIISVGYRVKSHRGTQFRQWATQRLKDYLVQGYAVNEQRLAQKNKELEILQNGIRILARTIEHDAEDSSYAWLKQFSLGLQLLDDYDHEKLDKKGLHRQKPQYPSLSEYREIVRKMRADFDSDVFGLEKDGGFQSATKQIEQSFGEQDVYPSIEEKAAMLLYLIVKNHAFVDGNKRIAAACFLLFLNTNGLLINSRGEAIISNEALATLTLYVASSKAEEMETVKALLISVLNRKGR